MFAPGDRCFLIIIKRSIPKRRAKCNVHSPGWMAQYATNPKMLATDWRLLAKNLSPQVVASVSVQSAVLVSFVSAVSGLAALGESGELGTSP